MLNYFLLYNRYLNIVGIITIFALAYVFSRNKKAIAYQQVLTAFALQILLAVVVLKTDVGRTVVEGIAVYINKLYDFTDVGIRFVFGNLADSSAAWGFIFAVKVLPITIFFAAFTALLFHWNIIQIAVSAINYFLRPLLKTSGAETLCAVANSFLGQAEAPLLVRHYLNRMTKSEMMLVMISGMATISGAILVVYVTMGIPAVHLLTASVMGIPAAIAISKILLPETEKAVTAQASNLSLEVDTHNIFDAIARGTLDGLQLALTMGAFLISFLALIAMSDYMLGALSSYANLLLSWIGISWQFPVLTFQAIFAYICAPFAYLLGFTGDELFKVGELLGTKVAINELVAYSAMVKMALSKRTIAIMTYALCGFASFSSIGIQVGSIGALAPDQRKTLTQLGLYAVLGGTLANLLSAMIAALLL